MALKGLDIFKLTPKTNCKDCGNPTCMAFAMKVAQGAIEITKCPHLSEDVLNQLAESTAPPMKVIKVQAGDVEYSLGGETVLARISCCVSERKWRETARGRAVDRGTDTPRG